MTLRSKTLLKFLCGVVLTILLTYLSAVFADRLPTFLAYVLSPGILVAPHVAWEHGFREKLNQMIRADVLLNGIYWALMTYLVLAKLKWPESQTAHQL